MTRVTLSCSDHVAQVRLNRPEKRNGFDIAMFEALIATGLQIAGDPNIRAIVIAGEGKAFSAGLDWMSIMAEGEEAPRKLLAPSGPCTVAQRACWIWREQKVPVIAAVHGATLGAGFQLALAADIRFGAADTLLGALEVKYGLIPDMTASQVLLKLVRTDIARELLYTGRQVEAEEAAHLGLLTRVVPDPIAEATTLARTIAAQSPHAVRAVKTLIGSSADLSTHEALALEAQLQRTLLGSKNQMEAVRATMMKDTPTFDAPSLSE